MDKAIGYIVLFSLSYIAIGLIPDFLLALSVMMVCKTYI